MMVLTRRGFLKTLLAAPIVAIAPSLLWVPPQPEIVVAEAVEAMKPLIEAVEDECAVDGYYVHPLMWQQQEVVREIIETDALHYSPRGRQMILLAQPPWDQYGGAPTNKAAFMRFQWRGARLPQNDGQVIQVAQCWTNGEAIEPQLWLA